MTTSTSTPSVADALVNAGRYGPGRQTTSAAPVPLQTYAAVRHAQVEIYCSHNAQAIKDIRAAQKQLCESTATLAQHTLQSLDQAIWLTLHDRYQEAETALDTALTLMTSGGSQR